MEFVCDDLRVVKKAHYALGLRSRAVVYRITFDAAPIEQADYMSWNELYTLFLTLADDPQDRQTLADIAELRGRFRFGHDLSFRTRGLAAQPNTYTFAPLPLTRDAADSGDALSYSFGELPTRADIPYVSVTATVRSEAFAVVPCRRPPRQGAGRAHAILAGRRLRRSDARQQDHERLQPPTKRRWPRFWSG